MKKDERFKKSSKSVIKKLQFNTKNKKLTESVRLNKFIANTGVCSRREADKFIEAGVVSVNGVGITKMGFKINMTDVVKFNGQILKAHKLRYVLLNKPKNYSGRIDTKSKTTSVMKLIEKACKEDIFPIDKLNKMDTGLLLFTNDPDLTKKIGNNRKRIKTIYQITLNKNLRQLDLENIRNGIFINNRKTSLEVVSYITGKNKNELGVEHSTGGIKLIKNLFEKIGYRIVKLDRVFLAGLTKKDLPRKHYRHLSIEEVNLLKRL